MAVPMGRRFSRSDRPRLSVLKGQPFLAPGFNPGWKGGASALRRPLERDLAGVIERQAAGGVEEPGEVAGERDERVGDVQGGEQGLVEKLDDTGHLAIVQEGIEALRVRILAEAVAR